LAVPLPILVGVAARVVGGYVIKKGAQAIAKKAAQAAVKQGAKAGAKKAASSGLKNVGKKAAQKSAKSVAKCPKAAKQPKTIILKANPKWTPRQLADAKKKVQALNKSQMKVNKKITRDGNKTSKYRKDNKIGKRHDVDHKQDLQLGGKDDAKNMWKLDKSVNRSFGKQINNQIKGLKHGTEIRKVILKK
jgi:hypothetical protein